MPSATRRIAIVGAGISGVVTAAHLKKENLDVTVYERSSAAGGIWLYDERKPLEPAYPPVPASQAGGVYEKDLPKEPQAESLLHAPPGPCYVGLKNNVGTRMLQTTLNEFPLGTEDFVTHDVLQNYIKDTAMKTEVHEDTQYNTEVKNVTKHGNKWRVEAVTLESDKLGRNLRTTSTTEYDAVVVASGHYHAAKVPNTPGLSAWKATWPDRITHSKRYRKPQAYAGQNILLIGGSVSSTDIARDLGPFATTIYQSQRNGTFDLPASLLPDNAIRIGEVVSYNPASSNTTRSADPSAPIPATVTLASGQKLCDIHHVILCTGYTLTLPFLPQFHADNTPVEQADENVIVTDGSQFHNLHKDIFYIPDPSLSFVRVPFFTATFTLFEFQAMVIAKVLSGQVKLPDTVAMREEYQQRVQEKGFGKSFHSLKDREEGYVGELVGWVNRDIGEGGGEGIRGHTEGWRAAKAEQVERMKVLFGGGKGVERDVVVSCW